MICYTAPLFMISLHISNRLPYHECGTGTQTPNQPASTTEMLTNYKSSPHYASTERSVRLDGSEKLAYIYTSQSLSRLFCDFTSYFYSFTLSSFLPAASYHSGRCNLQSNYNCMATDGVAMWLIRVLHHKMSQEVLTINHNNSSISTLNKLSSDLIHSIRSLSYELSTFMLWHLVRLKILLYKINHNNACFKHYQHHYCSTKDN